MPQPDGARRGRPIMPEGYGIVRDADGLLPWEWAEDRLAASRNYWIVTASADGRPHAAPVWGLWDSMRLYFSTDPASRKARDLASRPDLIAHLESGDDAVIIEGRARTLSDQAEIERFCRLYEVKYAIRPEPGNPAHGLFAIEPAVVLAWSERSFPTTATRWRFIAGS